MKWFDMDLFGTCLDAGLLIGRHHAVNQLQQFKNASEGHLLCLIYPGQCALPACILAKDHIQLEDGERCFLMSGTRSEQHGGF